MEPTDLPHELYRFVLEPLEPMRLPAYKGSTFRGVFGHSLRRVACALRDEDCPTCLVRATCTYQRLFETRVDPGQGPKPGVDRAPHPYVLTPPLDEERDAGPGRELACDLLLMGPARGTLPYLVYTFQEVGRRGLTRDRKPLALRRVEALGAEGWRTVYAEGADALTDPAVEAPAPRAPARAGGLLGIRLVTPLRLKRNGRFVRDFTPDDLLVALARRWGDLVRYYGSGLDPEPGVRWLLGLRGAVAFGATDLRWLDWTRYSNRQQRRMQLGGLVGSVELRGPVDELRPWLAWAERFHLGKATSFGLGKIEIFEGESHA
ncbi:CRISPR system precrRNA processing endoribonuclease RAMP protein Cas6 [Deferrisoma palaeochoriense]